MATRYDNIGKGGIVKEGIFVRFPELIPASRDNYWNNPMHRKLMIVGESNYFEENVDSFFKDPEVWYRGEDTQHLIPENKKDLVKNWKADYLPFDRLRDSMNAVSNDLHHCGAIYEEAMYYNYFLRPAIGGETFRKFCKPIDCEVAGTALLGIIELDMPDIVIFASKYAYNEFRNYIKCKIGTCDCKYTVSDFKNYFELAGEVNVRIEFVYHPSSRFQKWDKNENSKQKFERLLREYWIKK